MTKHFTRSEFSSPSVVNGKANYRKRVPVPVGYHMYVAHLMDALEVVRTACGDVPIRIASGYRTKEFNGLSKGRATRSCRIQDHRRRRRSARKCPAHRDYRDRLAGGYRPFGHPTAVGRRFRADLGTRPVGVGFDVDTKVGKSADRAWYARRRTRQPDRPSALRSPPVARFRSQRAQLRPCAPRDREILAAPENERRHGAGKSGPR